MSAGAAYPSYFTDLTFLQWLKEECGYRDPRPIPGNRYAAIQPLMFTHAIIIGELGDMYSAGDRWCYHDYAAAKAALDAWDGTGEPSCWHRHPRSGRRRTDGNPAQEYFAR